MAEAIRNTEQLETLDHIRAEIAIGRASPPNLSVAFMVHWLDWMLDRYAAAQEAGR